MSFSRMSRGKSRSMSGMERSSRFEETSERELVRDRVDVRETGEVTDDRAHRRATAATRREKRAWRVRPAHLARAFACDLEHLVVQEEEPRESEFLDERELAVESSASRRGKPLPLIALTHGRMADRGELVDGRLFAVREIRVAVPKLLGEIELEPLGEDPAPLRSCAIEGEALQHLLGRSQVALAVPTALRLAAFERRATADRDEHVLQQRPPRMVRMDVSGRDRLHAEVLGEVAEKHQAARVSALERALELDVEPVGPERVDETHCGIRIEQGRDRAARNPRGRRAPRSIPQRSRAEPRAAAARDLRVPPDAFPHVRS